MFYRNVERDNSKTWSAIRWYSNFTMLSIEKGHLYLNMCAFTNFKLAYYHIAMILEHRVGRYLSFDSCSFKHTSK